MVAFTGLHMVQKMVLHIHLPELDVQIFIWRLAIQKKGKQVSWQKHDDGCHFTTTKRGKREI